MATPDEHARQRALDAYRMVDSLPEPVYDDIVRLAAEICDVPVALLSLIDRDRQWFKARAGFDDPQTARDIAFCDYAIRTPGRLMEVPDTRDDPRFRDNPLTIGGMRFYAGVPLVTPEGAAIGTVCVLDNAPRQLDARQRDALARLARLAMALMDARRRELDAAREGAFAVAQAREADAAAATEVATAPRTIVVFELQDVVGAQKACGGERALERELQALAEELETRLDTGLGDSVQRVTGAHEWVGVLHGADVDACLATLADTLARFRDRTGLQVLLASATGATPDEDFTTLWLRADAALSARKAPSTRSA